MAFAPPSRSDQAEAISEEIVGIHWHSYEMELGSVDTVVEDGVVASVLRFEPSPAEELVVAAGRGGAVHRLRHESELELEPALSAAVERATGRTVHAFQTQTDVEQGVVLELFVLAPAADPEPV